MSILLLSWLAPTAHAATYDFQGLQRCGPQLRPCIDIRDTDAEIIPHHWLDEADLELDGLRSLFVRLTVEQSAVRLDLNGYVLDPADALAGRDGSLTWHLPVGRGDTLEFGTANVGSQLAIYELTVEGSRLEVD